MSWFGKNKETKLSPQAAQAAEITNIKSSVEKIEKKVFDETSALVTQGPNRGSSISFVDFLQSGGNYGLSFEQMLHYYDQCLPLANAVDLIAEGAASVDPILKKKSTGETVTSGPYYEAIKLLEYPNDGMDYNDFAKDAISIQLITNNPFLNMIGDVNRPPVALDITRPNITRMDPDRTGDLSKIYVDSEFQNATYTAEMEMGRSRYRSDDSGELWPMSGFNPRRGTRDFYAPAAMQPLYYEIEQYIMGNRHNAALLANGARPGGAFSTEAGAPPLTDKQFNRMQDQLQTNYQGPDNAGNPLLLEWVKYNDMLVNNRDMDYVDLQTFDRNSIYSRWNIPLALIDSKAMTYSNFGNAQGALFNMAVLPNLKYFFRQLKSGMLYRFGPDWMDYDITYDPATIPALEAQIIESVEKKSKIGVFKVNELRQAAALPEEEGGDVILGAANQVPVLDYAADYDDDGSGDFGDSSEPERNGSTTSKRNTSNSTDE